MPAYLAGRKTAGPALALRPFDDARSTHLKYRRHRMRTLTVRNTPHRALAQIHRIGLRHRCRPPFGRQLESDSQPLGNPKADSIRMRHALGSGRETFRGIKNTAKMIMAGVQGASHTLVPLAMLATQR